MLIQYQQVSIGVHQLLLKQSDMVVYLDDVGELSTKLGRDTKSRDINNDLTIEKKDPKTVYG